MVEIKFTASKRAQSAYPFDDLAIVPSEGTRINVRAVEAPVKILSGLSHRAETAMILFGAGMKNEMAISGNELKVFNQEQAVIERG